MIYKEIILSKNNLPVPVFCDNKTFCSKYDPEKEAEQFVSSIEKQDFFLMGGMGALYHINKLVEKFPDSFFLILENSEEDLTFLKNNFQEKFNLLSENKNISICNIDNLEAKLTDLYIPALYSTFKYISVQSWAMHIDQRLIIEIINKSLKKISQDFSVQAHFGKIWQKNIIKNLKLIKDKKISIPVSKTALIIAAGPTLDKKINFIREKRNDFYIIATDTGYKALLRNEIYPDCVVSVDGQNISHRHFMKKNSVDTLFIFELTGDNSSAKKIYNAARNIIFSVSQHPFEKLAENFNKKSFISLDSTSGTVTVACVDFAKKMNFSKILVMGADFGYPLHKSYAKGTYLDDIYGECQSKTKTFEQLHSGLMFRTELIKTDNKITSELLKTYEKNFQLWCINNGLECSLRDEIYCIENNAEKSGNTQILTEKFPFENFIKEIQNEDNEQSLNIALLPFISWMKNKKNNPSLPFNEYCKLARNFISRYNL